MTSKLLCVLLNVVIACAFAAPAAKSEPAWGRLYLRNGLASIQYFRDGYGAPMVPREVTFYFPKRFQDRYGCELLPDEEQQMMRIANGTIALVADRGDCSFETKSRMAEQMGAAMLVIVSEDESARAPVAVVLPGEIGIASVMIRKSAGDLLHRVSEQQSVRGRFIPMRCDRKPYVCRGVNSDANAYMEANTIRSGAIRAAQDSARIGEFLTATYGGILPSIPLRVVQFPSAMDGCTMLNHPDLGIDSLVVLPPSTGCSVFQRVSNVQNAGAPAAFVTFQEYEVLQHPSVEERWHAYNITIAAGVISATTNARLSKWVEKNPAMSVELVAQNTIAEAWDHIRSLATRKAWPTQNEHQQQLLERLLPKLTMDDGQLHALQREFLSVAGGSVNTWDQVIVGLKTATKIPLMGANNHDEL